jgi:L-ribulose-5-phosphate 3-epimerase
MLFGHLLGLYEKALPPDWSWEERLKAAKALGFDYIEISVDESDARIERLFWDKKQCMELLMLSREMEMPFKSLCLSVHRRYPFGSTDTEIRSKAYELMTKAVLFANNLGIRVIQLAGYDVYYETSTEETVHAFMEGMKWTAKLAEKHQVMLGMEIMDTPFMNSISRHLWYEKELRSPWYKVYPDLGNLTAWGNDVETELEKGISSIVAVHIKDTKAVTATYPGQFKCVPFGMGSVDFIKCFRKLELLNYSGPYVLEMWYDPEIDNLQAISNALKFIRVEYSRAKNSASDTAS